MVQFSFLEVCGVLFAVYVLPFAPLAICVVPLKKLVQVWEHWRYGFEFSGPLIVRNVKKKATDFAAHNIRALNRVIHQASHDQILRSV
jgi:hypothetical protein